MNRSSDSGDESHTYPSSSDILGGAELKCLQCGRQFSNSSALRFHRVKKHRTVENNADFDILHGKKSSNGPLNYHCPDSSCKTKNISFKGMRHLRQHYIRKHTPKSFLCECKSQFALRKDFLYHKKNRCPQRDKNKDVFKDNISYPSNVSVGLPSRVHQSRSRTRIGKLITEAKTNVPPYSESDRSLTAANGSPVIIIIGAHDHSLPDTIQKISQIMGSKNRNVTDVAVQADIPAVVHPPETSTVGVGVEQPQSLDFGGQFSSNLLPPTYYYQQQQDVRLRHTSTVTDFDPADYVSYRDSATYSYPDCGDSNGINYHQDMITTRSFGTIIDETIANSGDSPAASTRHAYTSMDEEIDVFRDTQTQTTLIMDHFWDPPE